MEFTYRIGGIDPEDLTQFYRGKYIVELDEQQEPNTLVLYAMNGSINHADISKRFNVNNVAVVGGGEIHVRKTGGRVDDIWLHGFSAKFGGIPKLVARNLGELLANQQGSDVKVDVNSKFDGAHPNSKGFADFGFTE